MSALSERIIKKLLDAPSTLIGLGMLPDKGCLSAFLRAIPQVAHPPNMLMPGLND